MSRTKVSIVTFSVITVLLSSCASDNILKTLNIGNNPAKEQISADQKKIKDLKKQLAAAEDRKKQLVAAEQNNAELSGQIEKLKKEISEKELTISIQGKIISLLDDADQTLQKSIEDQVKKRQPKI